MIENYYSLIEDNCLNIKGLHMTNLTFLNLINKMRKSDKILVINIIDIRNNNIHNFDFQLIKQIFTKVNEIYCDSKKSIINIDPHIIIHTANRGCSCSIL